MQLQNTDYIKTGQGSKCFFIVQTLSWHGEVQLIQYVDAKILQVR